MPLWWIAHWKLLTEWPPVTLAPWNSPTSFQVTSATVSSGLVVSRLKYMPAPGFVAVLRPAWKSCQTGARRAGKLLVPPPRNSATVGEKSPFTLVASHT